MRFRFDCIQNHPWRPVLRPVYDPCTTRAFVSSALSPGACPPRMGACPTGLGEWPLINVTSGFSLQQRDNGSDAAREGMQYESILFVYTLASMHTHVVYTCTDPANTRVYYY